MYSEGATTVTYLDIHLLPNLLEEGNRELERELERKRQIRAALAERRAERPPRFAALTARLGAGRRRDPSRPLVDPC
jgi:hypothetical protein